MKKLVTLLLLFLYATVCSQVDASEYEKIFSPDNVLIDVRTPSEYQRGHLKNARNIPYNNIDQDIKNLVPDKEQTVVVYCLSGKRADIAEKRLKSLGYKNVINGGKLRDLEALEKKLNPDN